LFVILLMLFAAASATLIAFRNPGYVLIAREPFVLETSLAVFLLIAAAAFAVLYAGVRLLVRILRVPKSLTRWRQTRRTRKAREAFLNGLTHLLGGEWLKAEQELVAACTPPTRRCSSYLGAALAAQGPGDNGKRDGYFARAAAQRQFRAAQTIRAQPSCSVIRMNRRSSPDATAPVSQPASPACDRDSGGCRLAELICCRRPAARAAAGK
jgi:HemY protein